MKGRKNLLPQLSQQKGEKVAKKEPVVLEKEWIDLMQVSGLPTVVLLSRDPDRPFEVICRNPNVKQRLYYRSLAPSGSGPWFQSLPVPEVVEQTDGTFELQRTAELFRLSPQDVLRTLELTAKAESVFVDLKSSQSRSEFKLVLESGHARPLLRSELLAAVKAAGSRKLPSRKNSILVEVLRFAVGFETAAQNDRESTVVVVCEDGSEERLSVAQVLYCLHLTKKLVEKQSVGRKNFAWTDPKENSTTELESTDELFGTC